MKYLLIKNDAPLTHISSGKLQRKNGFIHPRRTLDTFVLLVCIDGILHITQENHSYSLKKDQYLILFKGTEHFGHHASSGPLSYYWCHFKIPNDDYAVTTVINMGGGDINDVSVYYLLPENGVLSETHRAFIIFQQLLDLARSNCYTEKLPNFALSLLALEISQEYIENNRGSKSTNPKMEKVIEWVRINYNLNRSLSQIARVFKCNPDYLSYTFHNYMGYPLIKYIALVRISNAKKLLLETDLTVKEIAYQVGYTDEKEFMKRFKQLEEVTPTTYRNAFPRTKLVKK
ncbi:MAG: AraC family transcriptional regulator [Treponema sp.]|nr:AraC family transcriptional regulator [Treponema sp.]